MNEMSRFLLFRIIEITTALPDLTKNERDVEIGAVLTHWNNDFSSGSDEKQPLRADQVEITER